MTKQKRTIKVWDLPTRVFHWALVAVFAIAWLSSEIEGGAFWIHVYSGTLIIGFVAFRLVWGVIGSRHARFGDFIHAPATVMDYAKRLAAFRPPYSVGHNPLGGWMVVALLGVLALAVLSGLAVSEDEYVGPLAHLFGGGLDDDVHEVFANVAMVLIVIHVAGVLAHLVLSRENLPRAMVTGEKHIPEDVVAEDIRPAGLVRPIIAVAAAVAVVVYFLR